MTASPRFSVVTPVYDPPEAVLRAMLASVRAQAYPDWEHCIVDDASPSPHVQAVLRKAAAADPRVRVQRRAENGGIVAASNDALAMAQGEFVVLLDHDDVLHVDALSAANHVVTIETETDYLYTDEDKIDLAGRHSSPFFKPDWSPERFRTQMYTCHMSVLRRSLVEEVGGFHAGFEGSQDWDLVLRVTERARHVAHVPRVLYHWRTMPGSTAGEGEKAKPYAFQAGTRAIQEHCDRTGVEALVEADKDQAGIYHLEPRLRETPPVSIVIPTGLRTRDVRGVETMLVTHCVRSIVETSTYPAYDIVCVVDGDGEGPVVDELRQVAGDRLRIVPFPRKFNFSQKCNVGVLASEGEHVLLLNDDMEIITPNWLERLVMYSRLPGVGAVGAKLLFGDGRLQHVGVVFDGHGPGHVYRGYVRDYGGYFSNTKLACNYAAVTGACLMSKREVFEEVGGLTPVLPLNFNDIDYCMKLGTAGYRVVYDPDTLLYHFESSSRSPEVSRWEHQFLLDRWGTICGRDPYYNPNFNGKSVDFVPRIYLSDGSFA